MGNVGIYSVSRDRVYQIWQIGKTECFMGISREGLTHETLTKTSYHHLSWLFAFQSCAKHMLHFVERLLVSYPRKLLWSSNCLESSHSLSHTTFTIKSHVKYRVQKIEHNYNQFGTELKPIQNGCKSQLYSNKSVFPRRALYTWFLDLI